VNLIRLKPCEDHMLRDEQLHFIFQFRIVFEIIIIIKSYNTKIIRAKSQEKWSTSLRFFINREVYCSLLVLLFVWSSVSPCPAKWVVWSSIVPLLLKNQNINNKNKKKIIVRIFLHAINYDNN